MADAKIESSDISIDSSVEVRTRLTFLDDSEHDSYPMDIKSADFKSIHLPPLVWSEFDQIPSYMTIRNTGFMLNVQTDFANQRPILTGSVLQCPFEFWCFRFHWGAKGDEGSEHRIMGKRFPMEIHLVFHRTNSLFTNEAHDCNANKLILVYTCKLRATENVILKDLVSNLKQIRKPGESTEIKSFSLSSLFDPKIEQYLMYSGRSSDNERRNPILWMITSKPVSINKQQLTSIRSLEWLNSGGVTSDCLQRSGSAHRCIFYNVTSQTNCAVDHLLRDSLSGFGFLSPDSSAGRLEEDQRQMSVSIRKRDDGPWSERPEDIFGPPIPVSGFWQVETPPTHPLLGADDKSLDENAIPTKDVVIRSIDSLLSDLNDGTEAPHSIAINQTNVEKTTHREGVRMNSTALRREIYIKNKLQQLNLRKK